MKLENPTKRKVPIPLSVLLNELKPNSQVEKLLTIISIYGRKVTLAEARTYFEFINEDEYPKGFFDYYLSIEALIAYSDHMGIELFWKEVYAKQVYLKNCHLEEQYYDEKGRKR